METAIVGAAAAILGSLVGGLSSLLTSWLTQQAKLRADRVDRTVQTREALYAEFVQAAARLLAHAAENEDGSVSEMIPVIAIMNRLRLVAGQDVIDGAEKFLETAVAFYAQPNITLRQLSVSSEQRPIDPLKAFGDAARRELAELRR